MEIILLENVGNLGSLGDKVEVKAGYGRNFLIPHGKAVPATGDNVAKFEARRADLEAAAAASLEAAEKRAAAIVELAAISIEATSEKKGSSSAPSVLEIFPTQLLRRALILIKLKFVCQRVSSGSWANTKSCCSCTEM